MSAELRIEIEGQEPRTILLGSLCTIGRSRGNDVALDDSRASRQHAMIRVQGDGAYSVLDLGSANGTLVNGRRLTIPVVLHSGDEIQIAHCHMVFTQSGSAQAEPAAQPTSYGETVIEFTTETVTIFVVDIRNYTTLSESIPPEDLSRIVGSWFRDAGLIIERHGGVIDKFIGDAVMAIWRRTRQRENQSHVTGPLAAALELVAHARTFHADVAARCPGFGFAVGCGIHTGRAVLGNVGVDARRDMTVLGDAVNVAFRLESLCKVLGRPILVSDDVRAAAGDAFEFEDMGPQQLKGKAQDLRVFAVAARRDGSGPRA